MEDKHTIPSRCNWNFGNTQPILKDKQYLIESYIRYMLSRTQRIFKYDNLPETIPQRDLELLLQTGAFVIFTKDTKDGKFYVFYGGLGGLPNPYYQPTIAIVSNPYLKFFKTLELNDYVGKTTPEAVVIWNDSAHIGLLPMFERNASLLAETDISIRVACVNSRIPAFFKAKDDTTKDSIESMLEKIESGEIAVIGTEESLIENNGTLSEQFNSQRVGTIKELIELKQYLLGSWYNELGLNANFNMKREAINESEADLNEDALLPLIDDMLESRRFAINQINEMYGLNIKVDLTSSWKKIRKDILESKEETKEKVEEDKPNETVTKEKDVEED